MKYDIIYECFRKAKALSRPNEPELMRHAIINHYTFLKNPVAPSLDIHYNENVTECESLIEEMVEDGLLVEVFSLDAGERGEYLYHLADPVEIVRKKQDKNG